MDEQVQQPQEEILSQPSELETIKGLLAVEKDKYVRLLAEFDNMRKRQERERGDLIKYAHEEIVVEFLDIYDDLERALTASKSKLEQDEVLVKGIEMVVVNMRELLKRYDVAPMEPVGKAFDPHCHEPLMQAETNEFPDGIVMEEFQKGYTLAGRVVRTAKVKVAKNNAQGIKGS